MKIAIVGLGLIGGSLAKAIAKYTNHTVIGIDRNEDVLKQALDCGAIHESGTLASLEDADITIICIYMEQTISFIKENAQRFKKGSVVTDTCGVKQTVCAAAEPIAKLNGFHFIGGHPMAGKENFGFAYSEPDLFKNASYILTPPDGAENEADILRTLAGQIGFARTVITTPQAHDKRIAFTSQIPHALACAYVLIPEAREHSGFSAGSYRDVSRVANINETLWTELFLANRENLNDELTALIENLTLIQNAMKTQNAEELKQTLKRGRLIKEEIG